MRREGTKGVLRVARTAARQLGLQKHRKLVSGVGVIVVSVDFTLPMLTHRGGVDLVNRRKAGHAPCPTSCLGPYR